LKIDLKLTLQYKTEKLKFCLNKWTAYIKSQSSFSKG